MILKNINKLLSEEKQIREVERYLSQFTSKDLLTCGTRVT